MNEFIQIAIELAKKAQDLGEFPVGAVVINPDCVILGRGFNQKETTHDPTAHAEIVAIRDAVQVVGDWRLTDCILMTTLEPCPMCLGAILQSRIKKIVYLAKDIRWGACGTVMDFSNHAQLNHRCQLEYCPHDEVVQMMRSFFKDQKKRG